MIITPALIPENRNALEKGALLVSTFSPRMHLDITDGVFTPAISWPCGENQWEELESATELPGCSSLSVNVHLMVSDPERIGVLCSRAGAHSITVHAEAIHDADEFRSFKKQWKEAGVKKVGVALLLDTPLSKMGQIEADMDFVQLMSIANVGFQKQAFDERIFERIEEVRARFPTMHIAVDGGVTKHSARELLGAGAHELVVGSAIVQSVNPQEAYREIESSCTEAV